MSNEALIDEARTIQMSLGGDDKAATGARNVIGDLIKALKQPSQPSLESAYAEGFCAGKNTTSCDSSHVRDWGDSDTRKASLSEGFKALEQSEWVSVDTDPEDNQLVDMWHEDWVCEDSNPEGIRQGFLIHNEHWYSCKWIQHQDCYETSYDQPQKWKPITPPAEVET